jgi:peptidoglycan/xylan/chitin deacetylase (PgdA/CDA1 family)
MEWKRIALTFDDGPNGKYTLKILDILKRYRIKACFFLLGKNVERLPEIAKKIKSQGHLIGSHTYSHPRLKRLKSEQISRQIERCEKIFKLVLRIKPRFFRPPYGEYNKRVEDIVRKRGYKMALWDTCAEDWKDPPARLITKHITAQAKDNSIILLHDGANINIGQSRSNTVNALPHIIKSLRKKRFRIMRLDRLLPCQR